MGIPREVTGTYELETRIARRLERPEVARDVIIERRCIAVVNGHRVNIRGARGNILKEWTWPLRRTSVAEQMANDISGLYRLALLLIFKILYFAQQIVPIEINPPS